jgi:Family of unknown function (DUF6491)
VEQEHEMKRESFVTSALAVSMPAVASLSEDTPPLATSIPFALCGGIRDWRADGRHTLYIQARNLQWYHAALVGSCFELPFVHRMGFIAAPMGAFDRFSSVIVNGEPCPVSSPVPNEAPAQSASTESPATR